MSWTGANHSGGGFRPSRPDNQPTRNTGNHLQPPARTQDIQRPSRQPIHTFNNQRPDQQPHSPSHPAFNRRLFQATSTTEDQNHPDDLLKFIPDHVQAVADFDSSGPHRIHNRDMCSMIVKYLANPAASDNEPTWGMLLYDHLSAPSTLAPEMNLQDLYIWVTRVGLPNAIIDNRRFLLHYYLSEPSASASLPVRYDNQEPLAAYTPVAALPMTARPERNHQIFRAYPTPNGARFVQWLATPILGPEGRYGRLEMPEQMEHRVSMLDGYLNEHETVVRRVESRAMLKRTVGVLGLLWEVWRRNRVLLEGQDGGW
ncbi:hypothetical protein HBI88_235410 [Parastagonospora nodorum]|nr:hypothetical protein HBI46_202760 [Parastagonospora nodorum]KAH5750206.1 hypothetical protein HBI97_240030 [Parastagonospora nodorum]KAH5786112.1 hypothetical protein HBI96_233820 [Parastagonospora nodorum]KAH5797040.1 hypothetical protein HBI94_238000 [Parastagonospora nodorum]KAH5808093.1 hypothetical protein HBI93_238970 [Parastagonospora nodorum]